MEEKDWGTWKVSKPSTLVEDAITFGIQVTAPMPLSALQDLFKMVSDRDKNNPFYPKARPVFVVKKEDLKKLDVMDVEDIDDDVLGFFSLIMSYAKAAKQAGISMKDNGPKQLINFMPRTDFGTMFKLYIKEKLDKGRECRKKKKEDVNLFTIAKDLAKDGLTGKDMDDLEFLWTPPKKNEEETKPPTDNPDGGAPPPPVSTRFSHASFCWLLIKYLAPAAAAAATTATTKGPRFEQEGS